MGILDNNYGYKEQSKGPAKIGQFQTSHETICLTYLKINNLNYISKNRQLSVT